MSKFKNILNAAKDREPESVESVESKPSQQPKESPPAKKRGRPKGKRSNPDYEQVTAYIRRDTYKATKIALLEEEEGDFSDLVESLLAEWLDRRKGESLDG